MRIRPVSILLTSILFATPLLQAEESVRSTQEELRRRNLYFGDIDGHRSSEYQEAVRRYQKKKGFSSSGHEDPDTLRSLGLLARSPSEPKPKELEWPEEPVLKSDTKLNVPQAVLEVATTAGVAPESIGTVDPQAPNRRGRHGLKPTTPRGSTAPTGAAPASQSVSRDQALEIIKRYLHAQAHGDLPEELALYADHVDYLGNGLVDRRVIEHQLHKYYAQWPSRSYSLAKVTGYSVQPAKAEITVTFQVSFSLKSPRGRAKGFTENRVVLNAATANPRIVSVQERRVRP